MNSEQLKSGSESLVVGEVSARYRSSAVNSPFVPPGYKRTEVGIIPRDWGFAELKDRARVIDSLHQTPSFIEDGYAMVRVTDIKTGNLCLSGALRVSESIFAEFTNNYSPKRGDIVLSRVGSYGISSFVDTDEPFCMGQNTVVIESKLPARFLYYVLNSQSIKRQIEDESYGSGYKSLSLKNIKELLIPLPPTDTEQRAIADALSDVDALLAKLDQLIAKKRDLKQAAMQQLLTGQTRLPRFSGMWLMVKAGDIGRFRGGSGFPTKFQGGTSGEYPLFKVSDMNNEGNEIVMKTANNYISEGLRKQLGATAFPAESIVFAKVGAAVFLERKKILIRPSCLDNNMAAFVMDSSRAYFRFIYYALLNIKLGDLVSTTALPSLSGSVLSSIDLPLPSIPEQTAIATILSDMDAEIVALEARRDKTKNLKQGMMQELLTGRIRLL